MKPHAACTPVVEDLAAEAAVPVAAAAAEDSAAPEVTEAAVPAESEVPEVPEDSAVAEVVLAVPVAAVAHPGNALPDQEK
jgi:hypothetical protein